MRFGVLRDLLIALASFGLILWAVVPARAQQPLLNVSYDPTREFYKELNDAFLADWKEKGQKLRRFACRTAARASRPAP
jgi:ABC-type sulfate transport system substrate-binding protein